MNFNFIKILIITTLCVVFNTVMAQIPNNGFEIWEPDGFGNLNPAGWETTNDDPFISVEPFTPAKVGNYAMKVRVFDPGFFPISGIAMTDFPFNQRPTNFSAWMKTSVMPGDAVYLIVSMWKGDSLVASPDSCSFIIDSTILQYTYFSFPISYQSALYPDSANIMVIAGKSGSVAIGTEIILDELAFTTSVGMEENNGKKVFIAGSAYPNPASGSIFIPLTVNQRTHVDVDLFDHRGTRIKTSRFESIEPGRHDLEIPVDNLAQGLYTYRVTSEGTWHNGKCMISR
jgi:hypothetical protein